ncbi:MAG: hypothetical protein JXX28_10670 [Deltaproteobacteria bacterium]|nr:hypothetical protein [Deltaproteobacteria bacterium]
MEIRSESIIRHPRAAVYAAYRDNLPEIARDYMPDIKEIIVHKREDNAAGVSLHNEWVSSADLPRAMQTVIKPEMMKWNDFADWDDAGFFVAWRLKTGAFTDAVICAGRNTFEEIDANTTKVVLTGDLTIDPKALPVPRLLAGKMATTIEGFVVKMITPNLTKVNESLQTYLDKK